MNLNYSNAYFKISCTLSRVTVSTEKDINEKYHSRCINEIITTLDSYKI